MNIKHGAFDPLNDGWVHVAMGFSRGVGVQGNLHFCDFPGVGWGWGIGFLRNTEYWYGPPLSCLVCKISRGD